VWRSCATGASSAGPRRFTRPGSTSPLHDRGPVGVGRPRPSACWRARASVRSAVTAASDFRASPIRSGRTSWPAAAFDRSRPARRRAPACSTSP
jgi:hypothetical protein